MKRLIIALVFTFILHSGYSQLNKENWLVGGSASFSSTNSSYKTPGFSQKSNEFNLSLSPNVGYFLLDKFAIGLTPTFSWGKSEGGDAIDNNRNVVGSGGTSNVKRFLIGPFVRYYILDTEKAFNILVSAAYQYGIYSFKPTRGIINNLSFATGPVIFFNSSVGLEFLVGYGSRIEDVEGSYRNTQKGMQIGIGFQIHLEK